ncbi:DNA cytosine methyltransferase [Oceanicaulis sp.]|uniref:DNA cytosine methyltransferase n=1 Tax=Oceanicaulis sp. TaxID=1924941 RepID=UPI003F7178A7
MPKPAQTVLDLFCGPGGLSTGFEMAGFEVIEAYDYERSAVETFSANHKANATLADLGQFDMSEMPTADIILGGPPCTQFSSAKSNKTRNVLEGLLLVQAFLRCVYLKKPRYWIMENVPTIQKYLPDSIPLRWIGIDEDGDLEIPQRVELIASDYGVPQKRRRFLIGCFPAPKPTHTARSETADLLDGDLPPWKTLGSVLNALPSPSGASTGMVRDPNYGYQIDADDLTDHFYDASLSSHEARSIKRAKLEHPYMGKLAWPDKLDEPARTVVATQLGRETLIIADKSRSGDTEEGFRRATVRECATLQSFPITYQFHGSSYTSRYRQAGDAVPPMMAYAIAREIACSEGRAVSAPLVQSEVKQKSIALGPVFTNKRRKPNFRRKVRLMLPGKEVRGYRAELLVQEFTDLSVDWGGYKFNAPRWTNHLILGEGKSDTQLYHPSPALLASIRQRLCRDTLGEQAWANFESEFDDILASITDPASVYAAHVLDRYEGSPLWLADQFSAVVDFYLPKQKFSEKLLDLSDMIEHPRATRIRVRVAVGLILADRSAKALNALWMAKERAAS